jgi:tRNA U34 5-methylaminomethyl-2-thiouridine-forming methyltransferase MnmC
MTERELQLTDDGSHTIWWPEYNQHYHNSKGAWKESVHVFIDAGLNAVSPDGVTEVFEMGFGTGLNPLLTLITAETLQRNIRVTSLEAFPLEPAEYEPLNYGELLDQERASDWLLQIHHTAWETWNQVTPHFALRKIKAELQDWNPDQQFHVIYFDAFAPNHQPELWSEEVFRKMYDALFTGGVLTTYCAKGSVKRAMKAAGFKVEALPGALGKREMTRAIKD